MFHSADSKKFTFLMITVLSCGLCHGIDRNGDGLDDQWQQLHGISDANADFDQDGLSELAEYRFGTDPKNAQSKIELNFSRAVNGTKTIAWSGQLHKRYLVQYSENLTTWYNLSGTLDGTGSNQSVQDTNTAPSKRFYRLAAQDTLDSDGDGVDDWLEANVYSSNHLDALDWLGDFDDDRVPNIYEETKGTDKHDPASTPAADFFVNPLTGGTSNTDNIYTTISDAINAAPTTDANGDRRRIISVKPGTYPFYVYISLHQKIALIAESADTETVIQFAGNFHTCYLQGTGCVIDGFVFSRQGAALGNYSCLYVAPAPNFTGRSEASRITNCILREGNAYSGGGMNINWGHLIAENITVTNNRGSNFGKAVFLNQGTKLTLRNSIVWGNDGAAAEAIYRLGADVTVTNSWIEGGEQGGNASDPLITPTGYLSANSPARNIIPAVTALKKDIHGELRDSSPDAGADEFVSSDGDSLPDFWEMQIFGNLAQGDQSDNDAPTGDGLTNYYEYHFGFNPTIPLTSGNQVSDLYEAVFLRKDAKNYPVEWKADQDADGLTAGEELFYGSNPQLVDTNGDQIEDAMAVQIGISPISNDTDSDGVSNTDEIANGTNALVQDSDNDGAFDAVDAFPMDGSRSSTPVTTPGDSSAPLIALSEPLGAVPNF